VGSIEQNPRLGEELMKPRILAILTTEQLDHLVDESLGRPQAALQGFPS
jgi:hypothetical protein